VTRRDAGASGRLASELVTRPVNIDARVRGCRSCDSSGESGKHSERQTNRAADPLSLLQLVANVPPISNRIRNAPTSWVTAPFPSDTCYTCVVNTTRRRAVEFTSGSVALDLVDTVAARANSPRDLLKTPSDLAQWLKGSGLVRSLVLIDEHLLADTRDLREAVFRAASRAIDGKPMTSSDRRLLNRWAARMPLAPQLTQAGAVRWRADEPGPAAIVTIARDAVVLLGGELKGRLRRCRRCRMIFVDRSRPGQRRWCSSAAGCGNKERLARRRSHRAGRPSA
jgi:predicted RNA-binding Zn ribbon-like protein